MLGQPFDGVKPLGKNAAALPQPFLPEEQVQHPPAFGVPLLVGIQGINEGLQLLLFFLGQGLKLRPGHQGLSFCAESVGIVFFRFCLG
jgi:hypothetical protein